MNSPKVSPVSAPTTSSTSGLQCLPSAPIQSQGCGEKNHLEEHGEGLARNRTRCDVGPRGVGEFLRVDDGADFSGERRRARVDEVVRRREPVRRDLGQGLAGLECEAVITLRVRDGCDLDGLRGRVGVGRRRVRQFRGDAEGSVE